jgi:hypothetical protein
MGNSNRPVDYGTTKLSAADGGYNAMPAGINVSRAPDEPPSIPELVTKAIKARAAYNTEKTRKNLEELRRQVAFLKQQQAFEISNAKATAGDYHDHSAKAAASAVAENQQTIAGLQAFIDEQDSLFKEEQEQEQKRYQNALGCLTCCIPSSFFMPIKLREFKKSNTAAAAVGTATTAAAGADTAAAGTNPTVASSPSAGK